MLEIKEPACKRLWLTTDRCGGKWILEFPVFLITRQSWSEGANWTQCEQWTGARWCDIDEFCPPNEVMSYVKAMWLYLSPQAVPAEFIIPCDFMRERIPRFQYTWQQIPAINSSEMGQLRKVYYESTVRGFDANVKEDSVEVFTCKDMHGNAVSMFEKTPATPPPFKQVPSHGRPNACEYAVTLGVSSLGPDYWHWTTNNYREVVDHYAVEYRTAQLKGQPGRWVPFLRHTASKDVCTIATQYSVVRGNVDIAYMAHCTCTRDVSKCEPLRTHPLDGICPREGVVMTFNHSEFVYNSNPPTDQLTVLDGNAFSDTCRAQISFMQLVPTKMQLFVHFGDKDREQNDEAKCDDGWYNERQCVLITENCYRNVMGTDLRRVANGVAATHEMTAHAKT
ncbi:hypothetical protein AAVH_41969 [Aphelenchoides avenae]|nr:hypothetical protein AAVH_41969 [Aphelenchus avenae]